jgi:PAS domain S-box-containing protein/putative nucleotidyltransferase with HDIG domain
LSAAQPRCPRTTADFKQIAEETPHIIWVADSDGATTYVNRVGRTYLWGQTEDPGASSVIDRVHAEDADNARRVHSRAAETNSPYELTERLRRHDGQFRWHAIRAVPLRKVDDQVVTWISTATDIEDQRRAQRDLRGAHRLSVETARILDILQQTAPVGFAFVDRDYRLIRINATLAAINGASPEALVGRTVREAVPTLWQQLGPIYQTVVDTGEALTNVEVTGEVVPGRLQHWLSNFYPVRVDGDIIGIGIVVIEITERKELEEAHRSVGRAAVNAMAATVEARDPYTAGHQRRVAEIASVIAAQLEIAPFEVEGIRLGASIHDIGKIRIPAEILARPGRLDPAEFELVKMHAQAGYEIVRGITFPWPVADMIHQHHERWDGSGYPNHLNGHEIVLGARIIAVADVLEAMSAHRPYRPALGVEAALQEITKGRGSLFDADVADALLRAAENGELPFHRALDFKATSATGFGE